MAIKELSFITGNKNKVAEVQQILGSLVPLKTQSLDLDEIQGTVEEIAIDKSRRAATELGGPVLTEDTCLCFNALGGLPGPYIKWFLRSIGHQGLNNLLMAYDDKSAQAVCTFAYCEGPGKEPLLFQSRVDGRIVPARGPNTFGWDPIFEHVGEGETYAEMNPAKKNSISHRALALSKLKAWLQTQL